MNAAKEILEFLPRSVALATTHPSTQAPKNEPHWDFEETRGRFVELSGAAALTAALALILRAQERREPAAWIGTPESIFYAHDAAAAGVDLDALVVVRVPDATAVPRAADTLARSGAFGILVLDLGGKSDVPVARQSRLSSLAQKTRHGAGGAHRQKRRVAVAEFARFPPRRG
ncbi:MAG: hypothetical protein M5R36_18975 [Deltaproteobacteria bacterium]|nr:hypothetical protein [Deltaproteobacteria bacterium]